MIIPVVGMDPSFRHWGLASANLDLDSGILTTPVLDLIVTGDEPKGKQVRKNSYDLEAAETLFKGVYPIAQKAKIIFVEVPHGSQSAAAMKGAGVCYGILGSLRALGVQIIEVSEAENKKSMCNKRTATKLEMINKAVEYYPDANWPTYKRGGKTLISEGNAEHMADAIGAIHAGVLTPAFQQLMRLIA